MIETCYKFMIYLKTQIKYAFSSPIVFWKARISEVSLYPYVY